MDHKTSNEDRIQFKKGVNVCCLCVNFSFEDGTFTKSKYFEYTPEEIETIVYGLTNDEKTVFLTLMPMLERCSLYVYRNTPDPTDYAVTRIWLQKGWISDNLMLYEKGPITKVLTLLWNLRMIDENIYKHNLPHKK